MTKKEILLIVIIVFIAVGFWYSRELQNYFESAVGDIEGYINGHQILGIGAFIGLALLSTMLSPFSSVPVVPFAVAVWGKALTFVFLLSGWMVGGIFVYFIGRYALTALLGHLIPYEKIERYRKQLDTNAEFVIVVLLRLISPADIPGYVLGSIKYNFGKYILATLIAEILLGFVTVFASQSFIDRRPAHVAAWMLSSAIFLGILVYIFRKKIKK